MKASLSTRKIILNHLIDARATGGTISGAALAAELGISRNSVWKAIHSLQEEGYDIRSEQSKGYYLASAADILSQEAIEESIRRSGIPESVLSIQLFDSLDSTNNYCKKLPYDGPATAVLADYQSSGRGRLGRTFVSPKGTGIYLTYSFKPRFPIAQVTLVTTTAAVLTHRILSEISGETLGIKWVNDIYRGSRKICGILTEALGGLENGNFERIIVGIGINCLPQEFPVELAGKAGSLTDLANPAWGRNEIAASLIAALHRALGEQENLDDPAYLDYYREHCFIIGRSVDVLEAGKAPVPAYVTGIDSEYRLLVRTGEGERALSGGEVSLKL